MRKLLLPLLLLVLSAVCQAQLTILNVPSADVESKGKVYTRFDQTYAPTSALYTLTPNFMLGLGKGFEADLNIESFAHNGPGYQVAVVPGFKYAKAFSKSFTAFGGDKLAIPVHNKTYSGGNYAYLAGAYTYKNTRLTAGVFNSQNYVALGNRTGALLGIEQTIYTAKDGHAAIIPAWDWQSGKGSNGVSTFGLMLYPTKRIMIIPSYQVGNYGVKQGNHQAVLYVGYQLN